MSARWLGRLSTAAVALSLGTIGCSHVQRVGRGRTLRLALTEYRVNPESAEVTPGRLTIRIHNFGRLTHNLVLSRNGQSTASTEPIAPGGSVKLTVNLTPGTYVMASTILSDQALGEYGTLTVRLRSGSTGR